MCVLCGYQLNKGVFAWQGCWYMCVVRIPTKQGSLCLARLLVYVCVGYQLNKGVSLLGKVAGVCVCWIPTKQWSLFAWQGCWYMCVL